MGCGGIYGGGNERRDGVRVKVEEKHYIYDISNKKSRSDVKGGASNISCSPPCVLSVK